MRTKSNNGRERTYVNEIRTKTKNYKIKIEIRCAPVHSAEEGAEVAKGAAVALVVDDTPEARSMMVEMLQFAGLKVLEASDGQNALELIETSGPLIDVVLMDYRMPRMDGVEATEKIRQRFPQLPVLFVSAWDEPKMKDAAFEAGAAEYLVSPLDYNALLEAVSRVRRNP